MKTKFENMKYTDTFKYLDEINKFRTTFKNQVNFENDPWPFKKQRIDTK